MAELTKTKAGSHRATARGYAKGELIEEGQLVPADVAVSDNWMEKTRAGSDLERAVDEAQSPRNDDPNYEGMSKQALEAEAITHGITDPGKLSKKDLITAI